MHNYCLGKPQVAACKRDFNAGTAPLYMIVHQ